MLHGIGANATGHQCKCIAIGGGTIHDLGVRVNGTAAAKRSAAAPPETRTTESQGAHTPGAAGEVAASEREQHFHIIHSNGL